MFECVRGCQTDRGERWRAVSLYRVTLCCCETTRILGSRCCVSAESGPDSGDPGAVDWGVGGCGGEQETLIHSELFTESPTN